MYRYKLYMHTYVHVHICTCTCTIKLFDQHYIKDNKNLRYLINYWAKATYKCTCTCTNCTCTHMYMYNYVYQICLLILVLGDITIFITGYTICIIYCDGLMRFTIFTLYMNIIPKPHQMMSHEPLTPQFHPQLPTCIHRKFDNTTEIACGLGNRSLIQ